MSNHCHGFSLVEVLASSVVLSMAAIGITAAWRLADSKALLARLDHRASRILREYYELQTFAPAGASPLSPGAPVEYAPADPVNGFLYHPLKISSPNDHPEYDNAIPYSIDTPGSGQLTITYTLPGYGGQSSSTRTVTFNPSNAP
jgi:prepilin-type N-terminal cleavage/methylation domain-containing protein